jgi:hypothetical protein
MPEYKIRIERYGFNIEFKFDKECSGLYWKAVSGGKEEYGQISFVMFKKHKVVFVETSFTPEQVSVFPVFASSKFVKLDTENILPGRWMLKFLNAESSSCTLQILGAKEDSYEGIELANIQDMSRIGVISQELDCKNAFDKIFIKKSNYARSKVLIGDFTLSKDKIKFISDESLMYPEQKFIFQNKRMIEFSVDAPVWSFLTVKFYEN